MRLRGFKMDGDYPDDDTLMWQMFDEGKPIGEIAVALHVCSETIRRWLQIEEFEPIEEISDTAEGSDGPCTNTLTNSR